MIPDSRLDVAHNLTRLQALAVWLHTLLAVFSKRRRDGKTPVDRGLVVSAESCHSQVVLHLEPRAMREFAIKTAAAWVTFEKDRSIGGQADIPSYVAV